LVQGEAQQIAGRQRAHEANYSTSVPPVSIAVLIPCCNEEAAIGRVVRDFRQALPEATIYVYDNNSVDKTVEEAARADAVVCHERLQGKGNVVRRMFADIEADNLCPRRRGRNLSRTLRAGHGTNADRGAVRHGERSARDRD